MARWLLLALVVVPIVAGCSGGTNDVSISDTKAKERQIDEASQKLNTEQRPQGQ